MPEIKPYLFRTDASAPLRPNAPPQGSASVGRALQGAGDAIMQTADLINRRAEQAEVSDLGAKIAQTQAEHTIDWQNRMQRGLQGAATGSNSGDAATEGSGNAEKPGMAESFISDYDAKMAKISESIGTNAGRRYFEQQNSTLRREFAVLASQGQAELAGAKTKANFITMRTAQSSTLIQNPSAFGASLAMMENTINTMVEKEHLPALKAEELRIETQKDLAQNAVRGWIRMAPEDAERQLNSGAWNAYLDGDAKHALYGEINSEMRARKADQSIQEDLRKKMLKEQQDRAQNDLLTKIYEGGATVKDILHGTGAVLDPDKKQTMIAIMKQRQNEPERPDPGALRSVITRIHAEEGSPNKITTEDQLLRIFSKGGVTWEQLNNARGELSGKKTIQGQADSAAYGRMLKEAEAALVKKDPMGMPDPAGQANYNAYVSTIQAQISEARKQGKPVNNLLDPNSKEYLGAQVNSFRKSQVQIMQEMMERMRSASKSRAVDPDLKPEQISAMGMEELTKLQNSGLSPEQRKAARDRYDALKKGAK